MERAALSGSENIKNNTMTTSGAHGTAMQQLNGLPHPAISGNLTHEYTSNNVGGIDFGQENGVKKNLSAYSSQGGGNLDCSKGS